MVPVHFLVRRPGRPAGLSPSPSFNIAMEITLVAAPIIFYARYVIAEF